MIELTGRVERKDPRLPRFVVVPATALAGQGVEATTVVELWIDDLPPQRRTVKRWDERRWFISITESDCRAGKFDTGDEVRLRFRVAAEEMPSELAELLRTDAGGRSSWNRLTAAQQRMLRENVGAAKRSDTRSVRARRGLLGATTPARVTKVTKG